jgi:hypothetical protein
MPPGVRTACYGYRLNFRGADTEDVLPAYISYSLIERPAR